MANNKKSRKSIANTTRPILAGTICPISVKQFIKQTKKMKCVSDEVLVFIDGKNRLLVLAVEGEVVFRSEKNIKELRNNSK